MSDLLDNFDNVKNKDELPQKVRLFFKGGTYMDILREEAKLYETQPDWESTQEII